MLFSPSFSKLLLFIYLNFIGFSAVLWAKNAEKDTSMHQIAGRKNSAQALDKPYVILISADGFRYSYLQECAPKFLNSWDKQNITHAPLIPVFPSITFVNHYSIATGLYPGRHGIVNNFFPERAQKLRFHMNSKDSGWYKGVPLWSLAERAGVLSASLFWVGSEAPDVLQPSYFYYYHDNFTPKQKVDKVINWLKLPEAERPHFITLYFPEPDVSGHHYGPDSKEARRAVNSIDSALEYLMHKLQDLPLKNVNIIFLSDHGMISVDREHLLRLPTVDSNNFELWNTQTMATIYAKNPQKSPDLLRKLADSLRNAQAGYQVFLRAELPDYFHYAEKDNPYHRLGDIFLLPQAPKAFNGPRGIHKGKHGYDPYQTPQMLAVFYAYGPAFKRQGLIKAFDNVEIYAIIAQILGLKYAPNSIDGSDNIAKQILR